MQSHSCPSSFAALLHRVLCFLQGLEQEIEDAKIPETQV